MRTRFRYDPERPYEVLLTFHLGRADEADWVFSRELLRDGLRGLSGQGDVKLWPAYCPCWLPPKCPRWRSRGFLWQNPCTAMPLTAFVLTSIF